MSGERLPYRHDLADALCFVRRHDHPDDSSCPVSEDEADRLVRALSARYDHQAVSRVKAIERINPPYPGLVHDPDAGL